MSRSKKFVRSLASGYVVLGANILFTLASVPLALEYLSKADFSLWALATAIAQYIGLIDLGMSGTSRILIDYKDKQDGGDYGSVIQTFLLVSLVQGGLILVLGVGLAVGLVPVMKIPSAQGQAFIFLTIGQCALLAGGFVTRIFAYLLAAHQRSDVANYSLSVALMASYVALWFGFANNQGVYSTLWGQAVGWIVAAVTYFGWSVRLKLFPARGCWGCPTWNRFWEIFNYGRDIFLCAVGYQLLNASQTIILARGLGLEAAAVWSVCTRTYIVVSQLISRILEYSAPALAEMIVRGENQRLCSRFRSLVITSVSLAVVAAAMFAVCNQPFVRVWTAGKISWSPVNDVLLAIGLVIQAGARCHLGLVGQAKQIGSMRYLYLVEGAFFVSVSLWVFHHGVWAMLLASIAGTLLFSTPYGFWRTSRYFDLPWKAVALDWWLPPLRLAVCLVPVTAVVRWLAGPLPPVALLILCAAVIGMVGATLLFRFGLDDDFRNELVLRFPDRLRPLLPWLGGKKVLAK